MFRPLLLIGAVIFLVAVPAAHATPVYPGQHPVQTREFTAMVDAGVTFWAQRGVQITQPVELYEADDVGDAQDGLGETPFEGLVRARSLAARDYGVNRIVLRSDWLRLQRHEMRDRVIGRVYTANFCALLWHELGHIGGVANPRFENGQWVDTHPATGLMSQQIMVPGDCRALANRASSSSSRRTPGSAARQQRRTQRARSRPARRKLRAASRAYRRAVLRSESRALRYALTARR